MDPRDVEHDMIERKLKLAVIMEWAKENPLVDYATTINMFFQFQKETEIYKYCGSLTKLTEVLDNEIANDTYGYKSFLEEYIDAEHTTTVYQSIFELLS